MKKLQIFILLILSLVMFNPLLGQGKASLASGPLAKALPKQNSLDTVHVVEIFSFTCPYCFQFNNALPQLKAMFQNKLEMVHYPIAWVGPNPGKLYYLGAQKGMGQDVKNTIFRMFHESGIKNINDPNVLEFVAQDFRLDADFKKQDVQQGLQKQLLDGQAYAQAFGVRSTPTFIIEDALIFNGSAEELIPVINSLLKEPVNP